MKRKLYIKIFIPILVISLIIFSLLLYQKGLMTYATRSLVGYLYFHSTMHHHFASLPSNDLHDKLLLSKKINFFVHNFGISEPPYTQCGYDLFRIPRTACGGYVYMFRKIAGYYNIKTRPAYLFNIPNQGNHSLVEVNYEDNKWALFDPTFGTYFTLSGKYADIPLSLDEIYFNLYNSDLIKHVVSAKNINRENINKSLSELYLENHFNAPFMDLSNYQTYISHLSDTISRITLSQ